MTTVQAGELPPSPPPTEDTTLTSQPQEPAPSEPQTEPPTQPAINAPPLSKNALKRIRKQQEWEDGKDDRRKKRKEKRQDRRVRQREEREALRAQGVNPWANYQRRPPPVNVPVSIIIDGSFEQYMREKELISLGSQITRAYSENRTARFRTRIYVSDWKGKMFERFRDVLEDKHKNWKGIDFLEGDFIQCAETARQVMKEKPFKLTEALQRSIDNKATWTRDEHESFPMPDPEPEPREEYKDIVYLSSDSPYTLERLEPYTSYIIGGIVDKNREKGLCYKRARERGIRTAKLPIGQYMVMSSRQVLATNHVVEIMLKWLEYEDWGKAFLSVIPKRKGGQLRDQENASSADVDGDAAYQDDADEDQAEVGTEGMAVDEPSTGHVHNGITEETKVLAADGEEVVEKS